MGARRMWRQVSYGILQAVRSLNKFRGMDLGGDRV